AFFYLAALHSYIRRARGAAEGDARGGGGAIAPGEGRAAGLRPGAGGGLVAAWVLFLLSCLSKSAAVTLPLVMLIVDPYLGRRLTRAVWLEKIPFFVLSIVFGI